MSAAGRPAAGRPAAGRFTRRGVVVLGIVVLALLAFGATTQTWLTVRLPQDAVQTPDLAIAGSDAATPVTAFALVALAAALAVSIAGRVARWIIAVILVLSGVGITMSSAAVALDPSSAAEPAIGTAIGVSGLAGADAVPTAMPWVAAAAGVLLVLAAAWVVLAGRTWGINRRYDAGASRTAHASPERAPADAPAPSTGDVPPGVVPDDARADADADAPTAPPGGAPDAAVNPTMDPGPAPDAESGSTTDEPAPDPDGRRSAQQARGSAHADEIDSWDELSRGNDPTR
ncbi:Trp biosynthesis-associated membrane protein [Arthrobacter antioxidans]|uniref:Trp biosynthesis-associated membrane protein n=1 Tax=Arthrobacter antioxidans TaxID=2895818 RepID=UPI001FFF1106|nr:Trp biosynthesis-associated membrane protein [Arthrobacter antioxidans]